MTRPPRRPDGYGFVLVQAEHGGPYHIAREAEARRPTPWRALCGRELAWAPMKVKRTWRDGCCKECLREATDKEVTITDLER